LRHLREDRQALPAEVRHVLADGYYSKLKFICELSAEWSHFDFGVKEPLDFRWNGASGFSP
jgi:hypothetical protein